MERFSESDCSACGLPVPVDLMPDGDLVRYADAQAKIEALQRERDEAIRECGKESGFWGRTCARLMDKRDALQTALDAEREKMKGQSQRAEYAEGKVRELLLQQDALELNLTQLQALVRALHRERAASRPTWVCNGCGRVSRDGWINHVIESMDGVEYEMECPVCEARAIEEDSAADLARERDNLQDALDAERERVKAVRAEVWKEAAMKYALWVGEDSEVSADPHLDGYERFEDYCHDRATLDATPLGGKRRR